MRRESHKWIPSRAARAFKTSDTGPRLRPIADSQRASRAVVADASIHTSEGASVRSQGNAAICRASRSIRRGTTAPEWSWWSTRVL
ncbi:MAG: hypothetical protein HYT80_03305 [Euryarchaeota archaeon]|nr:hypothetical protein [Euryarchaeota archaeon]